MRHASSFIVVAIMPCSVQGPLLILCRCKQIFLRFAQQMLAAGAFNTPDGCFRRCFDPHLPRLWQQRMFQFKNGLIGVIEHALQFKRSEAAQQFLARNVFEALAERRQDFINQSRLGRYLTK